MKEFKLKCKSIEYFLQPIFIYESAKKRAEEKSKEDEQTLVELSSTHRCSRAKCKYKPGTLNALNSSLRPCLVGLYERKSARSVPTTSVKNLPYRPPARLIRAKYENNILSLVTSSSLLLVACLVQTLNEITLKLRACSVAADSCQS